MSDSDWTGVRELFAEALEQPPEERTRFVLERCAGRPDLLSRVTRLLEADRDADAGFLDRLEPSLLDALREEPSFPERIGPWRVLRPIGVGGMGAVLLAERVDGQFEQRAAIKLLRRGMDSDVMVARFLLERQILAELDHPNIARLLDGGIAGDGRPYIVMELVEGLPVTRYCEEHSLSVDQRLALVGTVCVAVEYAHRNLVVHRDLKPSNILVTAEGGPKLLDFGIAKLLPSVNDSAPATTLTQSGGRVLTPAYASPEQLRGGPITTSSDVYSMGAVLYEVLSGQRAWQGRDSLEDRLGNLDQDPPSMSSRVIDPELRRRLTGDLDVIVARALHAVPERRYHSMEALREDLRRHRQRLPVRARPDTLGYRASRFIRRHHVAVAWGAVVTLLVLAFAVTAAVQAFRIRHQANQLAAERDRARQEAATAQAVTDFLVEVFRVSDPLIDGRGDVITARALLDRGAEQIEAGIAGRPEIQASLLGAMGRAYANLEQRDRAEALLQRGVEVWRLDHPAGSSGLVAALQHLAELRNRMQDYAGAEQSLREALAVQTQIDSASGRRWPLYVDLVSSLHGQGAVDRARAAADTALTLYRREPLAETNADDLGRLAGLLLFNRQWDEMEDVYDRLLGLESRNRGPQSAAVAQLYNEWAGGRTTRGDYRGADSLIRIALAIHQELDPRSVATARTMNNLAANSLHLGEASQAQSLASQALGIYVEALGERHPRVAQARVALGETLHRLGRHEEAIAEYRLALAGYLGAGGPSRALVPVVEWRLAVALRDGGRPAESVAPFRSTLTVFEQRYPPDFLSTAQLRRDYAMSLVSLGRALEAEPLLRRAIEVLAKRYGDMDYRVDGTRITLARALALSGKRAEAVKLLEDVAGRLSSTRGPDDSLTVQARTALSRLGRR